MSERERVEALAKVLIEEGAGVGSSIHGWRCEYPDRYGPCACVDETAAAILASPAMRDLLAEAKADALREAADDMVWDFDGDVSRAAVRSWLNDIATANPYHETTTGADDA